MKTTTIILASAGVSQAFMPAARPSWVAGRSTALRMSDVMPETPAVYASETKKMLGAMETYLKGAEEIAAGGSSEPGTEFAAVPAVPELVRELFGDSSEAYKVAMQASGLERLDGLELTKGAVSSIGESVGFSSEYSADWCDVNIWWRAPDVVKARWGADSNAYKMAKAAADQIGEQATDAQKDADWDALYEFENSYAGGVPTFKAADLSSLGDEDKAMFTAMQADIPKPAELTDEELSGEVEPAWATRMKEEDGEMMGRLAEKLGDDLSAYDTEKWDDSDPLGKIKAAFGEESQTYKDAMENMAAFTAPPTEAEFDASLKELLGEGSERYKAAKAQMSKPAKKAAKEEAAAKKD